MAIIKATQPQIKTINLFSDSQAALKALDSNINKSKTLMKCRESLNEIAKHFIIKLQWIPGHQSIEGNCKADELARNGTTIDILPEKEMFGNPMATCKVNIKQKYFTLADQR